MFGFVAGFGSRSGFCPGSCPGSGSRLVRVGVSVWNGVCIATGLVFGFVSGFAAGSCLVNIWIRIMFAFGVYLVRAI